MSDASIASNSTNASIKESHVTNPSPENMPTTVLKAEHQIILRVIDVLERLTDQSNQGQGFKIDAYRKCVEFFRSFADACHHAKEEDLLFPALESRGVPREGGPIAVMLHEHTLARGFTAEMAAAINEIETHDQEATQAVQRFYDAAHQYAALLRNHIYKEDNILFNMGDRVLTEDDQCSLCDQFGKVGCRAFNGKTRDQLERLAQEIETE
jgi:hemerythrin-like domain-containing protein